ncbi:MAG: ankyrin repeat domain-containing protein [Rhodococcus sp. (in: high G+C Gram-positive bacteria)]|nr:MAG: ankyrin repeat domain-containing protein [Rhodococcus sp. (in: high G+C Gram-positive bacteria)]
MRGEGAWRRLYLLLLANGADPKVVDRDGRTALIWMVDIQFHRQQDTSDSIKSLVDAGTDVNAQDETGKTALAVAGLDPFDVRTAVLTALVENGADVNATDHNGVISSRSGCEVGHLLGNVCVIHRWCCASRDDCPDRRHLRPMLLVGETIGDIKRSVGDD